MMAIVMFMVLLYNPPFYQIVDRHDNEQKDELQGYWAPRMFVFAYSQDSIAKNLELDLLFRDYVQKDQCGISKFNKTAEELGSTEKLKSAIYSDKIEQLDVDMESYIRGEWDEFYSVNDWFTRMIKLSDPLSPEPNVNSPTARPIAMCQPWAGRCAEEVVSAPADARYLVFPHVEDSQRFWLKDELFTIKELLSQNEHALELGFDDVASAEKGDGSVPEVGKPSGDWIDETFKEGAVVIARLAPQDYHRYHSPTTGQIFYDYHIRGTEFYSVNYEAMPSANGAIFNKRRVTIVKNEHLGWVVYVNLGAACTSSIVQSTVGKNRCNVGTCGNVGNTEWTVDQTKLECAAALGDDAVVGDDNADNGEWYPGYCVYPEGTAHGGATNEAACTAVAENTWNNGCTYAPSDYLYCPRPQSDLWDAKAGEAYGADANTEGNDPDCSGGEGIEPEGTVGHYWKFRGDETGYFQFGGSTIVMIFQKDRITWDQDLTFPSSRYGRPVETLAMMGQKLGHKKGWDITDW